MSIHRSIHFKRLSAVLFVVIVDDVFLENYNKLRSVELILSKILDSRH
jgi:hypothetical protein